MTMYFFSNPSTLTHPRSLADLLLHFFNHQTHHRGQVSTLLAQAGIAVGVTDLLALIPEENDS
ncbi:DinB family protein [Haliea atlantica]